MKHTREPHILALEVRHSRIGYALFAGARRLLDWGASSIPPRCANRAEWIRPKLAELLRHGLPTRVVIRTRRLMKLSRNADGEPILETIRSVTNEYSVPVDVLGRDEIEATFRVFRAHTKEEIACAIVGIFPELLVRLPPKRKKWQPEPHGMIVFDAVSTGIAYWQRQTSH